MLPEPFSNPSILASTFLIDPKQEFTWHIDAPAESEEELYRH
jgi:hypothetical protein